MLSAKLRQTMLPAFLEYLSTSGHNGTLECESPDELRAYFWVQQGRIIRALCERETDETLLEGIPAIQSMLRWRYAQLNLFEGFINVSANMTGTILGTLLEAARLEDEMRREKTFRPEAAIRVRHNVSAYESLGAAELEILKKARFGTTVKELRDAFRGMPIDGALLELHAQGVMEIEGVPQPTQVNNTFELRAFLGIVIPTKIERRAGGFGRGGGNTSLTGFHKTVYDLINGQRSAEQLRQELRISRGAIRELLKSLRSAGLIDY